MLVEEADVAGRKAGGFASGVSDDGDAEPVAVAYEGRLKRAELLEVADRIIGAEDDEGIGLRDPVGGEVAGGFDEGFERRGDLEIDEGLGGELEAVVSTEEDAVEEGLIGGVGGVPADDVDERFRKPDGGAAGFALEKFLERSTGELAGVGFELVRRGENEIEACGEGHDERAWSMVREQPRGRAPGSRPMRVKEPSVWRVAKSWVRIPATLWRLARS